MKTWLIYKHQNKINNKIYIGQTCQDSPSKRWQNGLGYRECTCFAKAIKKYGWDNFEHQVIEDHIYSQEEANQREEYWIEFYHSYVNDPLGGGYNLSKGGFNHEHQGLQVYQIDTTTLSIINSFPSTREASRAVKCPHGSIMKCCDSVSKNYITAAGYYWCYAKDYETWIPKARNRRKHNPRSKKILCIDNNFNVINSFMSISEGAECTSTPKESILKVLQGKMCQAGGLYWAYADKYSHWSPRPNHNKMKEKPVYRIDPVTNEKKYYTTMADAGKENKIQPSKISRCCRKKPCYKTAGGFKWEFAERRSR